MLNPYGWRCKSDNKTFDAIIQTIGPIHIGSGQVLKKQDYIYDFHKSKVHMINGNQLVKVLKRKIY